MPELPPPPDPFLDPDLTRAQRILIIAVGAMWSESGEWPIWEAVEDRLAHIGPAHDEAKKALFSLPRGGARDHHSGYGYTNPLPHRPGMLGDDHRIELTVAAALAEPDLEKLVGRPFILTLKHMIMLYNAAPREGNQPKQVELTSEDLAKAIPGLTPDFIRWLPDIFGREPVLPGSFARLQGGDWTYTITRRVAQFAAVTSTRGYVEKMVELLGGDGDTTTVSADGTNLSTTSWTFAGAGADPAALPPIPAVVSDPYIDTDLIAELEKAGAESVWNVKKLVAVLRELNSNYTDEHPFASQALVRMVMDHIPPAFGQPGYAGVAGTYSGWGRTDKDHAKSLLPYRSAGDDVMHRQIGRERDLIAMGDLPPRTGLNAVLRGLLVILRKDVRPAPAAPAPAWPRSTK